MTTTGGSNSFSMRAVPTDSTKKSYIAVAGNESMPILQNKKPSTATFNLIRALPGTKGQYISFDFFDPGDGAGTGDGHGPDPPADRLHRLGEDRRRRDAARLQAREERRGLRGRAQLQGDASRASTHNGQLEHIVIPIPTDYNCDHSHWSWAAAGSR